MNIINAKLCRKMTDLINDREHFSNMHTLLGAISRGANSCTVYLGTELTESEVQEELKLLKDAGFEVYNYDVCTKSGGFTEPEYTHPAEHRVDISW